MSTNSPKSNRPPEPSAAKQQSRSYEWISTLRGFAALLVFTAHLPIPFPHIVSFAIGRTGVVLFFLITGYLAVQSRCKRSRRQYLFNRFVRMYPVFWLILIATYVVKIIAWNADFVKHLKDLALNMTLFNEFLGSECIIGTSWMMPIQVCFFLMLTVLAPDFFGDRLKKAGKRTDILFIAICCLTLAIAALRHFTGRSLPTAFGLLILVGLLGIRYHSSGNFKGIAGQLAIFTVTFIPSVILSYKDEAIGYIIAYAAGIALFVLADKYGVSVGLLNKLGGIGFSFFLAADIPHLILEKFIDTDASAVDLIIFIAVKFAASLVLAYLLTKFAEEPMLKKAKSIEKTMY